MEGNDSPHHLPSPTDACLPASIRCLPPIVSLPALPAGEIGDEWEERRAADAPADDLMALVELIVPYNMTHNAGAAAVECQGGAAGFHGGRRVHGSRGAEHVGGHTQRSLTSSSSRSASNCVNSGRQQAAEQTADQGIF